MSIVTINSLKATRLDNRGGHMKLVFPSQGLNATSIYYKAAPDVSSSSNDGTLTPGQSVGLSAVTWVICSAAADGSEGFAALSLDEAADDPRDLTFTGQMLGGVGDNSSILMGTPSSGQLMHVLGGTLAAPDTTHAPLVKLSRTVSFPAASVVGDGGEEVAAGVAITAGDAANQVQTVGWTGEASNRGTAKGATDSPDACGIYGVGRIVGAGIGVGIGGFFRGQADTSAGQITGLQAQTFNATGVDHHVNQTAFSTSAIQWLWADGANLTGVGIEFGNPFGQQVDVGIHFNGQVVGGKTGPTKTADIQSDSTAPISLLIQGLHSSGSIVVATGSGPMSLNNNFIQMAERATPANGPADSARLYIKDNGSGKTQLCVLFATGAEIVLATQV